MTQKQMEQKAQQIALNKEFARKLLLQISRSHVSSVTIKDSNV
jgi:hypothetical protein